jgi:SAM-dependent methyltransferase
MNSERWFLHWNKFPRDLDDSDLLRQVGKTVNGQPVDDNQIKLIVENLSKKLSLDSKDDILDLCCGNGLLTHLIVEQCLCRSVVGIDYSEPLIAIANRIYSRKNIFFILSSAVSSDWLNELKGVKYKKILMYEALQHFNQSEFIEILHSISRNFGKSCQFFVASIPDKSRIFCFYNTPYRRREYEKRLAAGNEAIGTWWDIQELSDLAYNSGFKCEIFPQPKGLYTAHYRFDAMLTCL